jgi:hypothetical protein
MYPGLGKLPLAPAPYAIPAPQYPSHLEIKPVKPSVPVIPPVIFRPPSEILRNFGELQGQQAVESKQGAHPAERPLVGEGITSPASKNAAGGQWTPPAETQDRTDPMLRPTRRQALGW